MEQKAWIIDEKTAKQYLTVEDAIDCVEKTWKWYGEGRVIMPNKITTDMSELGVAGWFNSMPAYIGPMDVAGIKVVGGYDGNKALGLPYIKANVLITDSKTGILRALISGDHINDLRTGAGDQLVLRRRFCKGPCVDCLRQLRFIDRAVKQPPVVFPDVLRVMDRKRRIHFLYCDRSIVVPVVRIRYTAVLRAKYDHLPHRIAAVPVAASGSLNDGIQRSQRAIQRFKVKVYPSLDALGRHDPAGQLLLQPLTDDLNLPAPVRGAQVRGKKENRVFGAKP